MSIEFYNSILLQSKSGFLEKVDYDISDKIGEIVNEMKKFREELDRKYMPKDISIYSNKFSGVRTLETYPLGYCDTISNYIYKRIQQEQQIQGTLFYELFEKNILIKRTFAIQNGECFQNAFQIGNYYVDFANDTVDYNEEKFYFDKTEKVDYKPIKDYNSFFKVAKQYWKVEIYPNYLIPEIAFICPYILKFSDGTLGIKMTHFVEPLLNDMKNDFTFAREFILNSELRFDSYEKEKILNARNKFLNHFSEKQINYCHDFNDLKKYFKEVLIKRNSNKEEFDKDLYDKSKLFITEFTKYFNLRL